MLEVKNLSVEIQDKLILKNLSIVVRANTVHALMGVNGSGKSTFAQTLMGHPDYVVKSGKATFNGKNILVMTPNERALEGLFLSFQYPSEIQGVTISSFLRMIYNKTHKQNLSPANFRKILKEKMDLLEMKEEIVQRYLNDGFSGGEKKRMEILQMLVLEPKLSILDETDSGLDIDALQVVSKAVNYLVKNNGMSVLLITHYTRVLKYIIPDTVHIMDDGVIVKQGDISIAHELEEKGYAHFTK